MVDIANTNSEGKGHGLACPACRVDLVMSERQGIEIDYCPKCRGVWLDRGELGKFIEKNASEDARALQSQRYPAAPAQPYPPQDRYDSGHGSGHGGGHGAGRGRGRGHGSFPRATVRLTDDLQSYGMSATELRLSDDGR